MTPRRLDVSASIETRETRDFASETKFLVHPRIARQIRDWAREHLSADPHGTGAYGDEYVTSSLYLDSEQLDVFHRRGSFGRAKYRIRRYGHDDLVFLERKMRTSSLLAKRRTSVAIDELSRLEEPRLHAGWPGSWFHQRLAARRLQPLCQVSYHRIARIASTEIGPARLTIDDQLRAAATADLAFGHETGVAVLSQHVIIEMKFRVAMPVLFKQLVERFALNAQPISKYRLALTALGQGQAPVRAERSPGAMQLVCA